MGSSDRGRDRQPVTPAETEPLQFQITNILRRDECVDMASADVSRLKRLVSNSESSRV